MKRVCIKDSALRKKAAEGTDAFVQLFIDGINGAIDNNLTVETLSELNADQITLLAYAHLREDVMDGGFVQLIHNGYGSFIFKNPFAKALKLWGMKDLSKLIYNVSPFYNKYHEELEKDCTDDEFMALFDSHPMFDDFDDEFVENEEEWTNCIAHYIDNNIEKFVIVENDCNENE